MNSLLIVILAFSIMFIGVGAMEADDKIAALEKRVAALEAAP